MAVEIEVKIECPNENDFSGVEEMEGWIKARMDNFLTQVQEDGSLLIVASVEEERVFSTETRMETFGWEPRVEGKTRRERREEFRRQDGRETARRLIKYNRRAVAERLMVLTVAMNGSLEAAEKQVELAEERDENPLDNVSQIIKRVAECTQAVNDAIFLMEN